MEGPRVSLARSADEAFGTWGQKVSGEHAAGTCSVRCVDKVSAAPHSLLPTYVFDA
jgi:hypothetical protein